VFIAREDLQGFGAQGRIVALDGPLTVESVSRNHPKPKKELEPHFADTLYAYENGRYIDRTEEAGLRTSPPLSSTEAVTGDFDNNGAMDLYVLHAYTFGNLPNALYLNMGGGRFVLMQEPGLAKGPDVGVADTAVVFDVDGDGRQDMYLQNGAYGPWMSSEGHSLLLRNTGSAAAFAAIQPIGRDSNYWAIGASVTVDTPHGPLNQQMMGMHNRCAASVLPLHFGLGDTNEAQATVRWPSGRVKTITIRAGEIVQVEEPPASGSQPTS
jgi:hypothetical protein